MGFLGVAIPEQFGGAGAGHLRALQIAENGPGTRAAELLRDRDTEKAHLGKALPQFAIIGSLPSSTVRTALANIFRREIFGPGRGAVSGRRRIEVHGTALLV